MSTLNVKSVLLLGGGLAFTMAGAEALEPCGTSYYYPSDYTCFDSLVLCPKLFGQATMPCAGACYSPDMYSCNAENVELLPAAEGPFVLKLQSSHAYLDGQEVTACGDSFQIGGETCVYCFHAPPMYDCSSYKNRTVFMPGGEMAVSVPGSQYWYVRPEDGALRFTAGGKANEAMGMRLAGANITVYEDGYFFWDEKPHDWVACPELDHSAKEVFRIFAATEDNLAEPRCTEIKLVTESVERSEGAYMYD